MNKRNKKKLDISVTAEAGPNKPHTAPAEWEADPESLRRLHQAWASLDQASERNAEIPDVEQLQRMLHSRFRRNRSRLWKELLLLWGAACILVGGGLSLAMIDWRAFAGFQAAALLGGVLFCLVKSPIRAEEEGERE
ncbi:YxlC family protein [Paenibacillus dendritiformis]|uniref:YxlC family protein n=1 Tax=Paenibacillus dendritiformis TaxID=130049 RepID=UPI00143DAB09|nr:YxlC family protein [Paenibacillus dendritiformis]NKI20526.1 YxlC family protein [Paenibacillus dendritiformis]NRF98783.1 YxlC family protein [Paenibacillus dendritiformis]